MLIVLIILLEVVHRKLPPLAPGRNSDPGVPYPGTRSPPKELLRFRILPGYPGTGIGYPKTGVAAKGANLDQGVA